MRFLYQGGKEKALTFSYDDGQNKDIRLAELLRKHGMKGTFNLNSATLADNDNDLFVNKNKLNEIYKDHEIAIHGLEHLNLNNLTDKEVVSEILNDRQNLEKLTGRMIQGMAYAFGVYNDHTVELLRSMGIKYSRTVGENVWFDIPQDFLKWDSTCHQGHNLMEKGKEFLNCPDWKAMPLMYVWGHSFELGDSVSWESLEEFCTMLEGKDNIWYATNGEIYDYITATKRLEFTFNQDTVYNPTALEIWFKGSDGKATSVKPGETKAV